MSRRPKIPKGTVKILLERDGPYCRYCGAAPRAFGWMVRAYVPASYHAIAEGLQTDHVIPHAKGGAHDLSNFVLACDQCNVRKQTKAAPPMRPRYPFKLGPPVHGVIKDRDFHLNWWESQNRADALPPMYAWGA